MGLNEIVDVWKGALLSPQKTFKEVRKKASLKTAFVWVAVVGAFMSIALTSAWFLTIPKLSAETVLFLLTFGTIVCVMFLAAVFAATSGFFYVFSKLFGGKGTYVEQTFFLVAVLMPLSVLYIAVYFAVLVFQPSVPPVFGQAVSLIFTLFEAYFIFSAVKAVHRFKTGTALAASMMPFMLLYLFANFIVLPFFS